jgi:hypothetical protein
MKYTAPIAILLYLLWALRLRSRVAYWKALAAILVIVYLLALLACFGFELNTKKSMGSLEIKHFIVMSGMAAVFSLSPILLFEGAYRFWCWAGSQKAPNILGQDGNRNADQPATKPADKVPAETQPPTPPLRDGSR